jgi:hypothetical protein
MFGNQTAYHLEKITQRITYLFVHLALMVIVGSSSVVFACDNSGKTALT